MNWYVQIVETSTGKVVKETGPFSERYADKIESGASINLDHARFHTQTVKK